MDVVLPLFSTVVSFVFAAIVLSQYLSRRRIYQLVWAFGLVSYGIGALTEFLKGIGFWNLAVYDAWYLFGAFFVAAYLGMGTLYLLLPRRVGHAIMALLLVMSVVAVVLVLTANVDVAAMMLPGKATGRAMPNYVRLLTPLFNVFGTVALVGGASYSAWGYWRRRTMPQRALSNLLIAVGALLPALGGGLLRFDLPALFYLCEFLGVAVIFVGFLANYEIVASRLTARAAARSST